MNQKQLASVLEVAREIARGSVQDREEMLDQLAASISAAVTEERGSTQAGLAMVRLHDATALERDRIISVWAEEGM